MKVHIMTDMEGVAGVVTYDNYCELGGVYYEQARIWLTREVNAAIEGLFEAGATEVLVADGHGAGGTSIELLDKRARLIPRPHTDYPTGFDEPFDAAIHIGQHAKSNTNGGHLCHTGSFSIYERKINEVPVGEFGNTTLLSGGTGIPQILFAGDAKGCKEAEAFVPGIITAPVLEGHKLGSFRNLDAEAFKTCNVSSTHLTPAAAEELIREKAFQALKQLKHIEPVVFKPPYKLEIIGRPSSGTGPSRWIAEHPNSILALFKSPSTPIPISYDEYYAIVKKDTEAEKREKKD